MIQDQKQATVSGTFKIALIKLKKEGCNNELLNILQTLRAWHKNKNKLQYLVHSKLLEQNAKNKVAFMKSFILQTQNSKDMLQYLLYSKLHWQKQGCISEIVNILQRQDSENMIQDQKQATASDTFKIALKKYSCISDSLNILQIQDQKQATASGTCKIALIKRQK